MSDENVLSKRILDAAFRVHTALGPGLLESAYESCLFYECTKSGLAVERQKIVPLVYESVELDAGYRLDMLVENKATIEVKAVEQISRLHAAQLLTYLKLSDKKLGVLLNFNTELLRDGIKRIVNGL
jgi:GxxExxY protein